MMLQWYCCLILKGWVTDPSAVFEAQEVKTGCVRHIAGCLHLEPLMNLLTERRYQQRLSFMT